MADYIDREEVLKHKVMLYDPLNTRGWFSVVTTQSIMRIPSADVAPVVHAKWIMKDVSGEIKAVCTHCGKPNKQYQPPYCPHCGAKMDEEDKNG